MPADVDHVEELARLAKLHQERLTEALETLENRIADLMATAPLKDGNLFDLEWAIQARAEIRQAIEAEYLTKVDAIVREYAAVAESTMAMLGTYGSFTKIDPSVISQLQKLTFQGFEDIGQEYLDIIGKAVYENTLTGVSFAESVNTVKQAVGSDMARYAKQQVHDSLMQFDRSLNTAIGKEAGATKWKYVGRIIETTRPFCRKHEGQIFTEEEIMKTWGDSWAGKASGNPFIVCGGYNCGHGFRPVF
jgi:hypothetical protein